VAFSERLKQLRDEKDMSREELAGHLGMSYSTIAKYETGNRFPDQQTLLKIADIFDVSIDYLLGKSDYRKPLPQTVAPYLPEGFDELSPEAKEEIMIIVEYVVTKYKKKEKDGDKKD